MFSRIWREWIDFLSEPVLVTSFVLCSGLFHQMATVVECNGFLSVSEYFDILLLFLNDATCGLGVVMIAVIEILSQFYFLERP